MKNYPRPSLSRFIANESQLQTGLPLILLCAASLLVALAGCHAESNASGVLSRTRLLMGTPLTITVPDRQGNGEAVEIAFEEVARVERLLSTWRDDSALAAINQTPVGEPITVDDEVIDLLEKVVEWSEETEGAFDPAAGRIVHGWDLRGEGTVPTRAEIAVMAELSGARHLEIDRRAGTVTRRADVLLEEGGFGKGYALDQAADVLRSAGVIRAVVDFGGQVTVWGSQPTVVAIAHPAARDQAAIEIEVPAGSVATSSGSERTFTDHGETFSHLFDPRTGHALPPRGSATVVHRSGLVADVSATALYVMGPVEGLAWAEERDLSAIFLIPSESGAWGVLATSVAQESLSIRLVDESFTITAPAFTQEN